MSKTDKTKPWRVRVAEHNPWAWHYHEQGFCDLPPSPTSDGGTWHNRPDGSAGCHWSDWNIVYKDNCCYGCGCRLCTGYWERREERRRDRHRAKMQTRADVKIWRELD